MPGVRAGGRHLTVDDAVLVVVYVGLVAVVWNDGDGGVVKGLTKGLNVKFVGSHK